SYHGWAWLPYVGLCAGLVGVMTAPVRSVVVSMPLLIALGVLAFITLSPEWARLSPAERAWACGLFAAPYLLATALLFFAPVLPERETASSLALSSGAAAVVLVLAGHARFAQ